MLSFVKTTARGGILFLMPMIALIWVFNQAHKPISKFTAFFFPDVQQDRFIGIAILDMATVLIVVLICFMAGLAAKTKAAVKLARMFESGFLSRVPGYDAEKSKLEAKLRVEQTKELQTVLVRFGEQWKVAFEIERISGGYVAVYFPGSPDPWSGSMSIIADERVERSELKQAATINMLKNLGERANEYLQPHLSNS